MAKSRRDTADSYTLRARREGYPARSVYKLEEIQKQHKIIRKGNSVLDVGAAPGSWTLYVQRTILRDTGRIVAVDLNPLNIDPVPFNVKSLTGDAFSPEIKGQLIAEGPYDAIISDAAPMTTGNRSVDTARSEYPRRTGLCSCDGTPQRARQSRDQDLPGRRGNRNCFSR